MEIHERIQTLRKTLGLSRRAFGEKIGVTESVIVNIEFNRLKKPEQKEPIYILICKEFNVNEMWLRTGEGSYENMFNKNISSPSTDTKSMIIGAISLMNEEQLNSLWKHISKTYGNGDD